MDDDAAASLLGGLAVLFGGVFFFVMLAVVVLMIAGIWKVFTKAGQPGWAAIIPIYNIIVLLQIVGRPLWWLVLMIIPLVSIVVAFIVMIDLAKSFGKTAGFGVGMALFGFIFLPMLGFGSARYMGPSASGGQPALRPAS